MRVSERAARIFEHLCNHEAHGYTQGSGRWGYYAGTETIDIAGKLTINGGDFDCSSSSVYAWQKALEGTKYQGIIGAEGFDRNGTWISWYTGNIRQGMTATGLFKAVPVSERRRGDILLNERQHAAMYLGDGKLGEFWLNEHNGITGGRIGDQTGWESHIRDYYDFPWDVCIRIVDDFEIEEIEVVTDNDINKIAERVWNFSQNGVKVRDRLQGTDQAANGALKAANAARAALLDKADVTGRGKKVDMPTRLAWVGKRMDDIQAEQAAQRKAIDALGKRIDQLIKAVG